MNWKDTISGVIIGLLVGCAIIPTHNQVVQVSHNSTQQIVKPNIHAVKSVDCTAYTACPKETDKDPHITASMTKVRPGIIAVSRDLFDQGYVFGKKVYIHGVGIYTIADLMNEKHVNRIDVFLGTKKAVKKFGFKQVKISLLEMEDTNG